MRVRAAVVATEAAVAVRATLPLQRGQTPAREGPQTGRNPHDREDTKDEVTQRVEVEEVVGEVVEEEVMEVEIGRGDFHRPPPLVPEVHTPVVDLNVKVADPSLLQRLAQLAQHRQIRQPQAIDLEE